MQQLGEKHLILHNLLDWHSAYKTGEKNETEER